MGRLGRQPFRAAACATVSARADHRPMRATFLLSSLPPGAARKFGQRDSGTGRSRTLRLEPSLGAGQLAMSRATQAAAKFSAAISLARSRACRTVASPSAAGFTIRRGSSTHCRSNSGERRPFLLHWVDRSRLFSDRGLCHGRRNAPRACKHCPVTVGNPDRQFARTVGHVVEADGRILAEREIRLD